MDRWSSLVTRAAVTDGGVLSGSVAVYDQPTTRQSTFVGTETIARGAFDGLLGGDIIATFNHDSGQLLGRSASGSLRLQDGSESLDFELDLPDTQLGRDVQALVRRGDLSGMSFSAELDRSRIERTDGGVIIRGFKQLVEISVVPMPAYLGTSVVAREASPQNLRGQMAAIRARLLLEKR